MELDLQTLLQRAKEALLTDENDPKRRSPGLMDQLSQQASVFMSNLNTRHGMDKEGTIQGELGNLKKYDRPYIAPPIPPDARPKKYSGVKKKRQKWDEIPYGTDPNMHSLERDAFMEQNHKLRNTPHTITETEQKRWIY